MIDSELPTTVNARPSGSKYKILSCLVCVINVFSLFWLCQVFPTSQIETLALSIQFVYFIGTFVTGRCFKSFTVKSFHDISDGILRGVWILAYLNALYYCGPFVVVLVMLPDMLLYKMKEYVFSLRKDKSALICAFIGAVVLLILGTGRNGVDTINSLNYLYPLKLPQIFVSAIFVLLPFQNRFSQSNSSMSSFFALIFVILAMLIRAIYLGSSKAYSHHSFMHATFPCLLYWSTLFANQYIARQTSSRKQSSGIAVLTWGTSCVTALILTFIFTQFNSMLNLYVVISFILFTYVLIKTLAPNKFSSIQSTSENYFPISSTDSGNSSFSSIKLIIQQVLSQQKSRRIALFLLINLSFTAVELVYGVWTNSLSLISDGFHMLFDCGALVMGLYATVISHSFLFKPSGYSNKSFARIEVLSGFVNGLFLIVISFVIMTKSIKRIFYPQIISTDRLLIVSIGGFLVNLVGIFAFHDHHCGGQCDQQHDDNMRGVFLHVMADTLGSVGVIISTLATQYMELTVADPICSLIISALVFVSVIPLLQDTSRVLLLKNKQVVVDSIENIKQQILSIEGIITNPLPTIFVWPHLSSLNHANVKVLVDEKYCEIKIASQIRAIFHGHNIVDVTIQTCKNSYFQRLSQLDTAKWTY